MTEFRIVWEIDIDADNETEAARKALAIQRDPTSTATVFYVTDRDNLSQFDYPSVLNVGKIDVGLDV